MRLRTALVAHPILAAALLLTLVGVAAGAVPAFKASEKPSFCQTCHEMRPYYDAWTKGAHKSIDCVECHVDRGTVNHVTHKVQASKELWVHLTGDPRFPQGDTLVPDARCLACHKDISAQRGRSFSHKTHVSASACIDCHSHVGHRVSLDALERAKVLSPSAVATPAATPGSRSATATAVHAKVLCSQCHSLSKMACATCHTAGHVARGRDCTVCHRPGPAWVFTHPASTECATCHAAPAKHFPPACSTCHTPTVPFSKTVYTHASDACATCHSAPAKHYTAVSCEACHQKRGVSWAASHPQSDACAACHGAPRRHYTAVSCASCHRKRGVSWAASHPSASSCASCHGAPAGHNRVVSCASCHHRPGASWAASHPSSSSCASCHGAPGSHYGRSCSSCHRPGVPWRSATFSHPKVQHGYRAFACSKCHPSGYGSHSCTTCHGPGGGDDDGGQGGGTGGGTGGGEDDDD